MPQGHRQPEKLEREHAERHRGKRRENKFIGRSFPRKSETPDGEDDLPQPVVASVREEQLTEAMIRQRLRDMVKCGRKQHGSLRALSERSGITASTLHRIARGTRVPSIFIVHRLAKAVHRPFYVGYTD